jgi:hypothetical protein
MQSGQPSRAQQANLALVSVADRAPQQSSVAQRGAVADLPLRCGLRQNARLQPCGAGRWLAVTCRASAAWLPAPRTAGCAAGRALAPQPSRGNVRALSASTAASGEYEHMQTNVHAWQGGEESGRSARRAPCTKKGAACGASCESLNTSRTVLRACTRGQGCSSTASGASGVPPGASSCLPAARRSSWAMPDSITACRRRGAGGAGVRGDGGSSEGRLNRGSTHGPARAGGRGGGHARTGLSRLLLWRPPRWPAGAGNAGRDKVAGNRARLAGIGFC